MKLKFFVFSLFCALSFSTLSAQFNSLLITGTIGTLQGLDTVAVNTSFPVTYQVENQDTAPYTGSIVLYYELNGDSINQYFLDSLSVAGLQQGDTTPIRTVPVLATTARFGGGVNIMVVWPTAQNAINTNELEEQIYVDTLKLANLPPDQLGTQTIDLYPNPVRTVLHLGYGGIKADPQSLHVLDAMGREVYFSDNEFGSIEVQTFSKGMYYVHLRFSDGQEYLGKFLIQ